jgi:hypothetical protein
VALNTPADKLGFGCAVAAIGIGALFALGLMMSSGPQEPEPPLSDYEKAKRGCQVVKQTYG